MWLLICLNVYLRPETEKMNREITNLYSAFNPIRLASRYIGLCPYAINERSYELILTKNSILIQMWQTTILVLFITFQFTGSFQDTTIPLTIVDKIAKNTQSLIVIIRVIVMLLFFYIFRKGISKLLTNLINLENLLNSINVYTDFYEVYKNSILHLSYFFVHILILFLIELRFVGTGIYQFCGLFLQTCLSSTLICNMGFFLYDTKYKIHALKTELFLEIAENVNCDKKLLESTVLILSVIKLNCKDINKTFNIILAIIFSSHFFTCTGSFYYIISNVVTEDIRWDLYVLIFRTVLWNSINFNEIFFIIYHFNSVRNQVKYNCL